MITQTLQFVFSNLAPILFVAAFVAAGICKQPEHFPTRLLSWLLLLSVGVEELWAGLFHVFSPQMAASTIGWQVSPFQFEMGVSDIASASPPSSRSGVP
jgi:hypothetical protein